MPNLFWIDLSKYTTISRLASKSYESKCQSNLAGIKMYHWLVGAKFFKIGVRMPMTTLTLNECSLECGPMHFNFYQLPIMLTTIFILTLILILGIS